MAINKKVLIWIGVGSTLLLGTGLFLYIRSRREGLGDKKDSDTLNEVNEPKTTMTSAGNFITSVIPTAEKSYPATPFINDVEGNKFRAWVNLKYPTYAKSIDLDPKGAFDNKYIRKAYASYGIEYNRANPSLTNGSLVGFKKGDGVYISPKQSVVNLYSMPEIKDQWIQGDVRKTDVVDKPIGVFEGTAVLGTAAYNTWAKITVPTYRDLKGNRVNTAKDFYVLLDKIAMKPF